MIRVVLPSPLKALAQVSGDIEVEIAADGAAGVSLAAVLDVIEARYPMLRGTIRDHGTGKRRAFVRFFACERDLSHDSPAAPLPVSVAEGREPLLIVGAMAGG